MPELLKERENVIEKLVNENSFFSCASCLLETRQRVLKLFRIFSHQNVKWLKKKEKKAAWALLQLKLYLIF